MTIVRGVGGFVNRIQSQNTIEIQICIVGWQISVCQMKVGYTTHTHTLLEHATGFSRRVFEDVPEVMAPSLYPLHC